MRVCEFDCDEYDNPARRLNTLAHPQGLWIGLIGVGSGDMKITPVSRPGEVEATASPITELQGWPSTADLIGRLLGVDPPSRSECRSVTHRWSEQLSGPDLSPMGSPERLSSPQRWWIRWSRSRHDWAQGLFR